MLKNAYLLAMIGSDTAENEQTFAKKLATTLPLGSDPVDRKTQVPGEARRGPRDRQPEAEPAAARHPHVPARDHPGDRALTRVLGCLRSTTGWI